MIDELRAAVERVALCPDEVQRIAAADLLIRANQNATRHRISEMARQGSAAVSRKPMRMRESTKA